MPQFPLISNFLSIRAGKAVARKVRLSNISKTKDQNDQNMEYWPRIKYFFKSCFMDMDVFLLVFCAIVHNVLVCCIGCCLQNILYFCALIKCFELRTCDPWLNEQIVKRE